MEGGLAGLACMGAGAALPSSHRRQSRAARRPHLQEGEGFKIAMWALDGGRVNIGACRCVAQLTAHGVCGACLPWGLRLVVCFGCARRWRLACWPPNMRGGAPSTKCDAPTRPPPVAASRPQRGWRPVLLRQCAVIRAPAAAVWQPHCQLPGQPVQVCRHGHPDPGEFGVAMDGTRGQKGLAAACCLNADLSEYAQLLAAGRQGCLQLALGAPAGGRLRALCRTCTQRPMQASRLMVRHAAAALDAGSPAATLECAMAKVCGETTRAACLADNGGIKLARSVAWLGPCLGLGLVYLP